MLVEEPVIRTDGPDGRWSIDGDRLVLSRVPATLTGVLQVRLDNLAPQELVVLQCASIVGRVFWDASIAALHEGSIPQIRVSLEASRARELVFARDQSVFAGCDELIFKHACCGVTYETVLLATADASTVRRGTSTAGDRLGNLDTVAHHHRLAGPQRRRRTSTKRRAPRCNGGWPRRPVARRSRPSSSGRWRARRSRATRSSSSARPFDASAISTRPMRRSPLGWPAPLLLANERRLSTRPAGWRAIGAIRAASESSSMRRLISMTPARRPRVSTLRKGWPLPS